MSHYVRNMLQTKLPSVRTYVTHEYMFVHMMSYDTNVPNRTVPYPILSYPSLPYPTIPLSSRPEREREI